MEKEAVEEDDGKRLDELVLLAGAAGGLLAEEGLRKDGRLSSILGRRGRQLHPVSTTATWRRRPTGKCPPLPTPLRAPVDDIAGTLGYVVQLSSARLRRCVRWRGV